MRKNIYLIDDLSSLVGRCFKNKGKLFLNQMFMLLAQQPKADMA
jgi:hypothetical protein